MEIIGQKYDDSQTGITIVAVALETYRIALEIKLTGDTTRQFSSTRFWTKKSTPLEPGFQNLEKNLLIFLL